ncbi:MAG: LPS assembly protein LptD [Methylococcales bacterium]|nr:LPS assembly protein LptD [Methylococcales bacterium]
MPQTAPLKTMAEAPVKAVAPVTPINATAPAQAIRPAPPISPSVKSAPLAVIPQTAPASVNASAKSASSPQTAPLKAAPATTAKTVINNPATLATPDPQQSNSIRPATAANASGWNCGANKKDNSWNCQLAGAAPEPGQPQGNPTTVAASTAAPQISPVAAVAPSAPLFSLLTPAFDHQQEQTFSALSAQLKTDPWANCSIELGTQREPAPESAQRLGAPMDVKSNYAEIFDNEVGSYSGNVKMARADQQASSNTANYDSVSDVLDLHGNVYYSEDELALHSDTATIKLAADQAKLRDVQFIAPTPLRGRAKTVYRDSKTLSRYQGVAYTSCRPGNQDWVAHASELKINKTSGRASTKNTWIEFKGTPVFYSPYLSFPIDNRRLSGFLAPVFGSTQNSGFNLSAPYYWNIAPNYDATLSPRYLTKRGALLAGNFRYLTEESNGKVAVEVMPNDSVTNKTRYLGSVKNFSQITPHINSNVDLNYVSDKTYFAELGNALSFPNYTYLRSNANIIYADKGISLSGRLENYQAINNTIPAYEFPYRKLPQINLNLDHTFKAIPIQTTMNNEFVYFQHDPANLSLPNRETINFKPSGQRINIKPSVSLPLQTSSAFFTPKVSFQHTQYFLSSSQPGTPDAISRSLPFVSADSGLFFERDLKIGDSPYLHTLEPRLFYLYVPYTNQQNIPLFDTAQYDFSYNSMFRENSFSGTDRIQNANQITPALTSRLVDSDTGRETLKLSVGEIIYFQDRDVTLPVRFGNRLLDGAPETATLSPLVAELGSELTKHISIGTGLQWDPHTNDIVRGKATLHYINEPDEIINVGYLYRKNQYIQNALDYNNIPAGDPLREFVRSDDIIQTDVSFRWPIYDNWYALGRWQYSLLYNTTQESFVGLEKENCCWRFRIIGRHYINNINSNTNDALNNSNRIVEGTSQNGIFFQVELKGLTGIGEKLDSFFEKNLYGYRKPQND